MSQSRIARAVLRAVNLVALTLAAQATQAAYVTGTWSQPYGTPFTDLGWRGTVTVDVPQACLDQPGPSSYAVAGLCAPATVLDAGVFFYAIGDPGQATVETLDFTPSLALHAIGVLSPGVLLGLQGGSASVTADESALAQFAATYASFHLELDFTLGGGPTARLLWSVDPSLCGADPSGCSGANSGDFTPRVNFSPVSEPGSFALTGLALLAGGLARRRVGGR